MAYLGNNNLPFDPTRSLPAPRDADRFSGNASTTSFTLSRFVQKAVDVEVYVENVRQEPLTAYDVIGTSLNFTGAPPSGTNNVYVVYRNFDSGAQVYVPDGSITYNKLANNIRIFTTDNLTPNGNNAIFTLSEPPADANTVMVTVDGIIQRAPVHYTVSGSTITFTSSPPAGSNVHVRHLGFRTTATVTQLAANSTISQPVITGGTITSPTISAASITGNSAIPNGSQLQFNTASTNFDIKPVTGASDILQIRSTYSGTTYTGVQVDYLGRQTLPQQPYMITTWRGTNYNKNLGTSGNNYVNGTFSNALGVSLSSSGNVDAGTPNGITIASDGTNYSRVTVPVTGTYLILTNIHLDMAQAIRAFGVDIRKNGVDIRSHRWDSLYYNSGTTHPSVNYSDIINMADGDYLTWHVTAYDSPSTYSVTSGYISVFKLA